MNRTAFRDQIEFLSCKPNLHLMNQILTPTARKQNDAREYYAEGKAFEEYIINLFNDRNFARIKWRASEKFTGTSLPPDHFFPDLEMELVFGRSRKYRFAVECKWRREFRDGIIKWAKDSQICSYRMFQDQVRIPVFVAIGIGGEPSNPEKLFVTPLNNIWMVNELYESDLIPFKRKPTNKFFYDPRQLKLF
jgi:hypothetical protein